MPQLADNDFNTPQKAGEEILACVRIDAPSASSSAFLRLPEAAPALLPDSACIFYRSLQPGDLASLREAHLQMFPVDYEDAFFERVVRGQDGLENLAAVSRDPAGNEDLIGFVTGRAFYLYECDPVDRGLLGLSNRLLDYEKVSYILTLGVSPPFRQQGIASSLIQWIVQHAKEERCRAVYLHVIAYNEAAIALYRSQSFAEVACRQNFYYIWSGRQPDPQKEVYDAFLYGYIIDTSISKGPINLLMLAIAPVREIFSYFHSCLPWSTPRGNYFGGGELPPLDVKKPKLQTSRGSGGSGSLPPWLVSLFSRKEALRQQ